LAWDFVAHTDSRFDPDWLRRFTQAYQRIDVFQIGEIWALAISLRVVLVENLRRLAEDITSTRTARQQADALADALLGLKGPAPADPMRVLRPFEETSLDRAFIVQLFQRLRDQGGNTAPALHGWTRGSRAQGAAADESVRAEHQDSPP